MKSTIGRACGYGSSTGDVRSLKIGRLSCRNENGRASEVAAPSAPGITGGVAWTDAVAGATAGGLALEGRPGKCGSDGKEISAGIAGTVAGTDAAGLGDSDKFAGPGSVSAPGRAVKKSFAMRASSAGSGMPRGRICPGSMAPGERGPGSGSGVNTTLSRSLVFMVLTHFDVIEYGDRVVGEDRCRAIQ